jgi:hypothetical protein
MRWTREAYLDLMTFKGSDRPMFVELFGLLVGLEQQWRDQGATQDEVDLVAFDWDYVPVIGCGGECGPRGYAPVVLEETAEYRIERDYLGRTSKLFKQAATIPLPLDFPVRNMDDWLKLKPMYQFAPDRVDWSAVERAAVLQAQGHMVVAGIPGAFNTPRELMGEELACMAYYDQPELMQDILATLCDTALRVLERVSEKTRIDQLSVHEDFAGKSGPLVGPGQIEQYFKPYYRKVWDLLQSRGCRIFQQDTDGNVNSVIPSLLECGLSSIMPMEPAAGMDIVALRKAYGRGLAMAGGIDKHVLRQDKAAIRRELEYKMQPLMRQSGGIVFGLDHRIPNGTPLENYRYYVDLSREILGLPPRSANGRGWQRMAF